MRKILCIILSIFIWAACSKDELIRYEGVDQISFVKTTSDTLEFSFAFHPGVSTYRFGIPVKLTGYLSGEERFFNIRVIDSLTTAEADVHYEQLAELQPFGANRNRDTLFIVLKKNDDLAERKVRLGLELCSGADFKVDARNFDKVFLKFTSRLSRPSWWFHDYHLLGAYSDKKYALFIEVTGVSDLSYGKDKKLTYSEVRALALQFKHYLQDQKPAILEEDGNKMKVNVAG